MPKSKEEEKAKRELDQQLGVVLDWGIKPQTIEEKHNSTFMNDTQTMASSLFRVLMDKFSQWANIRFFNPENMKKTLGDKWESKYPELKEYENQSFDPNVHFLIDFNIKNDTGAEVINIWLASNGSIGGKNKKLILDTIAKMKGRPNMLAMLGNLKNRSSYDELDDESDLAPIQT